MLVKYLVSSSLIVDISLSSADLASPFPPLSLCTSPWSFRLFTRLLSSISNAEIHGAMTENRPMAVNSFCFKVWLWLGLTILASIALLVRIWGVARTQQFQRRGVLLAVNPLPPFSHQMHMATSQQNSWIRYHCNMISRNWLWFHLRIQRSMRWIFRLDMVLHVV